MIVIDPVITDTAKLADFHLRVRPGTDAWCLAALAAVLVQEDALQRGVPRRARQRGRTPVRAVLADVSIADYALRCGVDEDTGPCRRPAESRPPRACPVFEDLRRPAGAQQHTVLVL